MNNPITTLPDEAKRKQREQAAVSTQAPNVQMDHTAPVVQSPTSAKPAGIADKPKTIDIGGIPHLDLPDQKFPGPLSMMASAAAGTIGHIASAPFSSDSRLEANRAGLDTSAEVATEQKRQEAAKPKPTAGTPMGTQAAANAGIADLQGRQAGYMIDNNLSQFEDKGNGIARQVGSDGKVTTTNVDTAALTDKNKGVVDDSASALRDQQSNNPYWSPAAQLERMQRRRLMTEAGSDVTDPNVQANAQKALGILGNPVDNALKQAQAQGIAAATDSTRQQADLRNKLLTETDPAKRMAIQESLLVAQGRDPSQGRYVRLGGGEQVIDPVTGQKAKQPDTVFDSRTGQTVQSGKRGLTDENFAAIGKAIGLPADALKSRYADFQKQGPITRLDQLNAVDVALALADGTPPEKIASKIKSLGGNPAEFGL